MNKNLLLQINKIFFNILAEEDDPKKIEEIFDDLLTPKEKTELLQKVACALYLDKGRAADNIEGNLKVDTKLVSGVNRLLGNPGYQYLIQHAKAEEFAQEWSVKIMKLIKTVIP
jgi:uncharacterized protein YerC